MYSLSRCSLFSEHFLFIWTYLNRIHLTLPIVYDWNRKHNYLESTKRLFICMWGWFHKPPFPATGQQQHGMDSCFFSHHSTIKKGVFVTLPCLPSIHQLHLFYVWCTKQWSFLLSSWYPVKILLFRKWKKKVNYSMQIIIHTTNLRMRTWLVLLKSIHMLIGLILI